MLVIIFWSNCRANAIHIHILLLYRCWTECEKMPNINIKGWGIGAVKCRETFIMYRVAEVKAYKYCAIQTSEWSTWLIYQLVLYCAGHRLGFLHWHSRPLDADERFHVRQRVWRLDTLRAASRLSKTVLPERRGLFARQHIFQSWCRQSRHWSTVSNSFYLSQSVNRCLLL